VFINQIFIKKRMVDYNYEKAGRLNHLSHIAADGEKGYKNAAEDVENQYLKSLFLKYSFERSKYVRELLEEIIK